MCPRRRSGFLLLRQKKVTKEKATLQAVSLRFATGNLRCSRPAGSRSNSLRFTALKQSRALIRWPLRSSAHPEGNPGSGHPHGPLLRCAALGPTCSARGACAREVGPSEAMARRAVRLLDVRMSNPLLAAPAAGRLWGEHGRRSAHASCSDAPWNSLCCCAAPLGQPRRVSSRSMGASTPMRTPQPPRRRRSQQGVGQPNIQQPNNHSGHCFARPHLAGASATRCAGRAERSKGPCGCPHPGFPSGCAEERSGQRIRARDCLSAVKRSELERDPAGREHRRLPAAKRRDAA